MSDSPSLPPEPTSPAETMDEKPPVPETLGLPPLIVSKKDVADLLELIGEQTEVAREEGQVVLKGRSLTLSIKPHEGTVTFEASGEQLLNPIEERLARCVRPFWRLTHGDWPIFLGALFPLAAGALAPAGSEKLFAALGALPWLIYAYWVLRNSTRRWCELRES